MPVAKRRALPRYSSDIDHHFEDEELGSHGYEPVTDCIFVHRHMHTHAEVSYRYVHQNAFHPYL